MKCKFDKSQKPYFWICIIGLIFWVLDLCLVFYAGIYFSLLFVGIPVIGIIVVLVAIIKKQIFLTLFNIVVDGRGVFVKTKKGKIIRRLLWENIKIYTIDVVGQKTYVCISTNENLKPIYYHKVAMINSNFKDCNTLCFLADSLFVAYADAQLLDCGNVCRKKCAEKYTPTKQEEKKRYLLPLIIVAVFVVLSLLDFLFLML